MRHRGLKHLPAIRKIPDDLWDEIKLLLPPEKANNTIGRPIIPFRKVLDGIVHVLKQRNKKYGLKARLSGIFSRTKGDLIGITICLD